MKKLLLFVILLAVATGAGLLYLQKQEYVVVLSEAELQERIEAAFPVERTYLFALTLRLSEPRARLVEGSDRIDYRMRASLAGPGQTLSGTARVSGALRYDPATRNIYLDRSVVEEIDIDGVPSRFRTPLRETADLLARQHLDRHSVYTVDEEFFPWLPGTVVLRDARVEDGELRLAFGLADRFWTRLGTGGSGD